METANDRKIHRLIVSYGEGFLRYILAIPEGATFEESVGPSHTQAIDELYKQMQEALVMGDGSVDMSWLAPREFTSIYPNTTETTAQVWRKAHGGEVEGIIEHTDPVSAVLFKIARDIWPSFLISTENSRFPGSSNTMASVGAHTHPEHSNACRVILEDESLSKLFPDSPPSDPLHEDPQDLNAIHSHWIMSTGQGGTHQLSMLPATMLTNAAVKARIEEGRLTYDSLGRAVIQVVQEYRELAQGKTVESLAIVGLGGVTVPTDTKYTLGLGEIRAPLDVEVKSLLPQGERVNAVLTFTHPIQILKIYGPVDIVEDDPFSHFQEFEAKIQEAHRTIEKRIDRIRMSLLLASDTDDYLATTVVSRHLLDPTQQGSISTWGLEGAPVGVKTLDREHAVQADKMHQVLLENNTPTLDIAHKRLLGAVTQRWDALDAFIDAVIVWENAFGVSTETTFRVTGSIAKLLEPKDRVARETLLKELKSLYLSRSKLVHGSAEPKPEKILESRHRAISIAHSILKALYTDRTDLLPLTSEERGRSLLIGS